MLCTHCTQELPPAAKFCQHCGTKAAPQPRASGDVVAVGGSTVVKAEQVVMGNQTGDVVARDKIIQNIVVVGELLNFTQIENLIPKSEASNINFKSVVEAFEKTFENRLGTDMALAVASAGEILRPIIQTWFPKQPYAAFPYKQFIEQGPTQIIDTLDKTNYWGNLSVKEPGFYLKDLHYYSLVLWLPATQILCKKILHQERLYGIGANYFTDRITSKYKKSSTAFVVKKTLGPDPISTIGINQKEIKIILAGLAIDLIRFSHTAAQDLQFWNQLTELLSQNAHSKSGGTL